MTGPILDKNNVRAKCPDCGGSTTFEFKSAEREYGYVVQEGRHSFKGEGFEIIIYRLLRCAGCGRGGLAKIHSLASRNVLESFLPFALERAPLPGNIPEGIETEFREAELCTAFGAYRAASALFRSVIEKTMKANGYAKGDLKDKIDQAAADRVITEARKQLAHANIRVLGNDVLHDDWRSVDLDEVNLSHRYMQRILEDLYDDRETVEGLLKSAKRIS